MRVVRFTLAGQFVGISIEQVSEVIAARELTRVPLVPNWVRGVINLRGEVVPVLDLAAYLGMQQSTVGAATRIIIVRAAHRTAGILADGVDDVRTIDFATLQAPPPLGTDESRDAMVGVVTLPREPRGAERASTEEAEVAANKTTAVGDGVPTIIIDMTRVFASDRIQGFARRRGLSDT